MREFKFIGSILALLILNICCSNKMDEVNKLFETIDTDIEYAEDVIVIYSDSAKVRLEVAGPFLERYVNKREPKDVFPKGVHVEFFNDQQEIISWLDSKYMERLEKKGLVYVRDSVVLYNTENEKLETSELIWDEVSERIYTDKFVRITQPERGDTSYGYGFETSKNFNEFIIKKNFSAKMSMDDISSALGQQ